MHREPSGQARDMTSTRVAPISKIQYYFLGKEVSFEKLIPKCWLKFCSLDESIKRFHFLMRDSRRLCNILKILLIFFIWQSINIYRGGCWINIREDVCQFWILISNLEYIPGIFLSYLLQWIVKICNIKMTEIEKGRYLWNIFRLRLCYHYQPAGRKVIIVIMSESLAERSPLTNKKLACINRRHNT